jgi:hypothetical protein
MKINLNDNAVVCISIYCSQAILNTIASISVFFNYLIYQECKAIFMLKIRLFMLVTVLLIDFFNKKVPFYHFASLPTWSI